MAKPKLVAGRINRRGVGYVESPEDAHIMLEWAHARARSSKPKGLRVVISEQIAPQHAPDIVALLKIGGYESHSVDQRFTKAVAKSPFEKELDITVLNPRVLYYKEKALKKLQNRYEKVYISRHEAQMRLKDLHAELNRAEAEARANNSRISELQHNIKTIMLIRAAAKPPPLHLPQSISPEYLRLHYAFLIDPLFLEADPPVLKPTNDIAESIVKLWSNRGLPPAGAPTAVSELLTSFREELAIRIRKLVTLDLDKDVLLQEVDLEETAINTLNDLLPQIMKIRRSKSVYGADGFDEEGAPGGQAPPPDGVAGDPADVGGGVAGGPGDVGGGVPGGVNGGGPGGAPAPNVASTLE